MHTSLHLGFTGNCDAAFAFYETVFGTKRPMTMKWSDAPGDYKCPDGAENLVMHTALKVGSVTLMGADAPPGQGKPFGGFDISIDDPSQPEVERLFAALSEGGTVTMPWPPPSGPLYSACAPTNSASTGC